MADKLEIKWNTAALNRAVGESAEVRAAITKATAKCASTANANAASFRTGRYYDREEGRLKGDTQARYAYDVESNGPDRWPVGLVYPANYAAMKENYLNNTLLKAVGNG